MDAVIYGKHKLSNEGADSVYLNFIQINIIVNGIARSEDDDDYETELTITKINESIEELEMWNRLNKIIDEALEKSGWNDDEIKSIEICPIGGALRTQYFKDKLIEYLKNHSNNERLTLTLNMDDSLCLGLSYYGGIKKHLEKCSKYECDNMLHYEIIDNTKFERNNEMLKVEYDIHTYIFDIENLDKNDSEELDKGAVRIAIEKEKYDFDHYIEDNTLRENELYKKFIDSEIEYHNEISNFLKSPNVNQESINELRGIYDDEKKHNKIIERLKSNQLSLDIIDDVLNIKAKDIVKKVINSAEIFIDIGNVFIDEDIFIKNIKNNYINTNLLLSYKNDNIKIKSEICYDCFKDILKIKIDKRNVDDYIERRMYYPRLYPSINNSVQLKRVNEYDIYDKFSTYIFNTQFINVYCFFFIQAINAISSPNMYKYIETYKYILLY